MVNLYDWIEYNLDEALFNNMGLSLHDWECVENEGDEDDFAIICKF